MDPGNRELGGGDLDFPKEPHSVNYGDGVTHKGETPPMSFFQGSSNVNIHNSNFHQIYGNATINRFGDGQFTEDQRNLICEFIANHANFKLPDINHNLNRKLLTQSIINLPRVEAVFDDYQTKKKSGPCFEGTRVALLREMAEWATGSDESCMYILSGLAGIGKSTVAYTIASRATDLNLLGASFFFSRDEADRKNAKKFFTTIAYQLCVYNETFAEAIGDVLQTQHGSAAITKSPQEQLKALIVNPLQSIIQSRARPILIVVDALDECDEEDGLSVLIGLKQLVRDLPSFKVILTTRPQPYLDHFFGIQDGNKVFRLQDIESKVVDSDIQRYLKYWLSVEQVKKRLPTRKWGASDEEIDSLVRAAGRLFIIASTSVRYILDKVASNPTAQMKKLLSARMPFKDLNEFYTVILRNVAPVDCDDDIVDRYQSVIGAIITVQHPLPVPTLAHLIDIDADDIRAVIVNLQSVILLDDDDIPRIYHKSLPDYITDSKRCKDSNLYIDPIVHHIGIIIRCFEIMEQCLKYNILDLGTPARFMSNDDGLAKDGITEERLERNIPTQLQYACIYWANHLEVANIEDTDIMKELEQFADKHMLHWFEALSLMRRFDCAHRAIRIVLKFLKSTSDLHRLLLDALRFISKFYSIIETSALHTYYSALSFTPTDTLLYHRYIKEAADNICSVEGGPEKWDALVSNWPHGEDVDDIKFSLDNTMFASLSKEVLKVWDAVTGTPISTINAGDFAIANNFSTVASFKDNAITLYNVNGSEQAATFTTRADIVKVAISSESSRIAAALLDETLCLWDSGNGKLLGNFESHQDRAHAFVWWNRLQFSPTGARLAYSSGESCFVHLRNGIDGSFIADLDYESSLQTIAFSADGSRIAVLTSHFMNLWNSEDGKLIGIAQSGGGSMAISANGYLLATGDKNTVTLWSGVSVNPLPQNKVLSLGFRVLEIAFSLDDILAISTAEGIKLYNVKSQSFISALSPPSSTSLAFSPDCTRLAGSSSGTVFLWDIRGIEASSPFANGQGNRNISALALSLDYSRVACGFENGEIELWDTGSLGKRPITPHTHHTKKVTKVVYSPDSRQFASVSNDGTIHLWDGKAGVLRGTLEYSTERPWQRGVEISNTVLAVAGDSGVVLWDLKTLDRIHTFGGSFHGPLSFSVDGALLAAVRQDSFDGYDSDSSFQTIIFDVTKCAIISTFDSDIGRTMAFLPDNSQLIIQPYDYDGVSEASSHDSVSDYDGVSDISDHDSVSDYDGVSDINVHDDVGDYDNVCKLLTFNLATGKLGRGSTFSHFMQLRNMPLWHGVPVLIMDKDPPYLGASFSGHDRPVPVLWIPKGIRVDPRALGCSAIALCDDNWNIIIVRIRTGPLGR